MLVYHQHEWRDPEGTVTRFWTKLFLVNIERHQTKNTGPPCIILCYGLQTANCIGPVIQLAMPRRYNEDVMNSCVVFFFLFYSENSGNFSGLFMEVFRLHLLNKTLGMAAFIDKEVVRYRVECWQNAGIAKIKIKKMWKWRLFLEIYLCLWSNETCRG